jgi:predicted MFS family arabinose efflux permease
MTTSPPTEAPPTARHLDAGLMLLLAATQLMAASTIHYQTSMLGAIAVDFGVGAAQAGWVATGTFSGFLLGIVLLVPLGDRLDKRGLILSQHLATIVALLGMAAAPTLPALVAMSVVTGVVAGYTQNIVPFVAELARPNERGRAVSTILTALFLGILFGRVASGLVASYLGWRWIYLISAGILLALSAPLLARLPSTPPKTSLPYRSLIRSILHLLRVNADLRRVATTQFLLGICYGGFWATLAPMLLLFHQLGPAQAGLIGIPGAAGILVARPAGRWMDRRGVIPVVTTGAALVLAAFLVFAFAAWSIGAVIAGAVLLDSGLRAAMVANQTLANFAVPDARSRANTIFAGSVWSGNAAGAFLASVALTQAGWLAVCAIGASAAGGALALQRLAARR